MEILERILTACRADDFNTPENRCYVNAAVQSCLDEMAKTGPVPVDYNVEIDYNNNSLIVHFSKEYTDDKIKCN